MNNGRKIFMAVLIDLALLAILITSCYFLIFRDVSDEVNRILTLGIIIVIPAMFYITYITFAGNKFEYDETAYEREFGYDNDDTDETEHTDESPDNDSSDSSNEILSNQKERESD